MTTDILELYRAIRNVDQGTARRHGGSWHNNASYDNSIQINGPIVLPSNMPPIWDADSPRINDVALDYLSSRFTGRESELEQLATTFTAAVEDTPSRCVLYGAPGQGKTQLSLRFAKMTFDSGTYSLIFWMSATCTEKLHLGFSRVLDTISHPGRSATDQASRLVAVKHWLSDCTLASVPWLLIVDDVDESTIPFLRENLPNRNKLGHILFTTRSKEAAVQLSHGAGQCFPIIEIQPLAVQESITLLLGSQQHDKTNLAAARKLVQSVGCLPLAVDKLATTVAEAPNSLSRVLERLPPGRIEQLLFLDETYHLEQLSVAATFSSTLDNLKDSPDALFLLIVFTFLDYEKISNELILNGVHTTFSAERIIDPNQFSRQVAAWGLRISSQSHLQETIRHLQRLSLIQTASVGSGSTCYVRIHDLIRRSVQDLVLDESSRLSWLNVAIDIVCGAFRQIPDPSAPSNWGSCEAVIPHFQALNSWDETNADAHSKVLAQANVRLGNYLTSRGLYGDAVMLYSKTLLVQQKIFGEGDSAVAENLFSLASALWYQERYGDAELACKAAVKAYGASNTPEKLCTLHILGMINQRKGHTKRARKMYLEVRAQMAALLPDGHNNPALLAQDTALASVYHQEGKLRDAARLYEIVLKANIRLYGEEASQTMWIVASLGQVYMNAGQLEVSERLYRRALVYYVREKGRNHPDSTWTQDGLEYLLRIQGKADCINTLNLELELMEKGEVQPLSVTLEEEIMRLSLPSRIPNMIRPRCGYLVPKQVSNWIGNGLERLLELGR